jgi:hypothetical protein
MSYYVVLMDSTASFTGLVQMPSLQDERILRILPEKKTANWSINKQTYENKEVSCMTYRLHTMKFEFRYIL